MSVLLNTEDYTFETIYSYWKLGLIKDKDEFIEWLLDQYKNDIEEKQDQVDLEVTKLKDLIKDVQESHPDELISKLSEINNNVEKMTTFFNKSLKLVLSEVRTLTNDINQMQRSMSELPKVIRS
jgi:sugar-specific transcriptional regulator TrmB